MRKLLAGLVLWKLTLLAKLLLRKYQPRIVAVAGCVGKTTTKELIGAMLSERFRTRVSKGSYNSEWGVPLTILDRITGGRNIGAWFGIFWHAVRLLIRRSDYPEVLVLELGVDHPGDMDRLVKLVQPDVAVVTNVRDTHLVNFENVAQIAEENSKIIPALKGDGVAVLNFDDTSVRMMRTMAPDSVVYYGLTDEANVWLDEITVSEAGVAATLHLREREGGEVRSWPLRTTLVGRTQLYAVGAALAVAYSVGVVPEHAVAVAQDFVAPPGRLRLFAGRDNLTVIDDSYNASPQAMVDSLAVLKDFPEPRTAILGTMAELGIDHESGHALVGNYVADWLDRLIVVGEGGTLIAEAAKAAGMDADNITPAATAEEAAAAVGQDGSVLVKASRAVGLEAAVEALLADPRDASHLVGR